MLFDFSFVCFSQFFLFIISSNLNRQGKLYVTTSQNQKTVSPINRTPIGNKTCYVQQIRRHRDVLVSRVPVVPENIHTVGFHAVNGGPQLNRKVHFQEKLKSCVYRRLLYMVDVCRTVVATGIVALWLSRGGSLENSCFLVQMDTRQVKIHRFQSTNTRDKPEQQFDQLNF